MSRFLSNLPNDQMPVTGVLPILVNGNTVSIAPNPTFTCPDSNSGNTLDTNSSTLTLVKPGVTGQSNDSVASFMMRRFVSNTMNPYTEMTIALQHTDSTFTNNTRFRSDGGVYLHGTIPNSGPNSGTFQCLGGAFVGGAFYVGGNISCNAMSQRSDERLKKNVEPLTNCLEKVNQLQGVRYTLIEDEQKYIGLIAQSVEPVYPEFVLTSIDGTKNLMYQNIVAVIIEAVKELNLEVKELQKKK